MIKVHSLFNQGGQTSFYKYDLSYKVFFCEQWHICQNQWIHIAYLCVCFPLSTNVPLKVQTISLVLLQAIQPVCSDHRQPVQLSVVSVYILCWYYNSSVVFVSDRRDWSRITNKVHISRQEETAGIDLLEPPKYLGVYLNINIIKWLPLSSFAWQPTSYIYGKIVRYTLDTSDL